MILILCFVQRLILSSLLSSKFRLLTFSLFSFDVFLDFKVIFQGHCPEELVEGCLSGRRMLELFILTGPVLAVWNNVTDILHQVDKSSRIQVVRLRTSDRVRVVGMLRTCFDCFNHSV